MAGQLQIDPSSATPLWSQIESQIRLLVASGALQPNRAVPSVRDLARELRVNPATVAKAYRGLVVAEILIVRRGEGTFVASQPPTLGATEREEQIAAIVGKGPVTVTAKLHHDMESQR